MEVVVRPPFRPKITAPIEATVCSTQGEEQAATALPQSSPDLQTTGLTHSTSSPPWPARKRGISTDLQMRRRNKEAHLLKKASPDLQILCSLHHEGLTRSFTGDHYAPRESARVTSLQEKEKTALFLEMPSSILLLYHHCSTRKKNKQGMRQIWPKRSGNRLQNSTRVLHLNLQRNLSTPAPRLHSLRTAAPVEKASAQPGAKRATLKLL